MTRISSDLIDRIMLRVKFAVSENVLIELLQDLEQQYIYSQTKAWILSSNSFTMYKYTN